MLDNSVTIPRAPRTRASTLMSCMGFISGHDFIHWIWEPPTDAVFLDNIFAEKTGYGPESFPQTMRDFFQFVHPDDRQELEAVQNMLVYHPKYGDFKEGNLRFLIASGEYIWIFGRITVVQRDRHGHATKLCGAHVHFHDMAQKQNAYFEESDRLRHALDANGAGPWDWNVTTGTIYFSQQYCTMLGYTQEEFAKDNLNWAGKLHPDDYEATLLTHFTYIQSPDNGDYFKTVFRIRHKSGAYRWIVSNGKVVARDTEGKATRIVGMHTDVTQVKFEQDALIHALHYDSLTGVCSRFYFDKCISQTEQKQFPISIICADVDGLKLVNDYLGHHVGDTVLVAAAELLRNTLPHRTLIGRVGGDEFTVLISNCNSATAASIVQQLYEAVAERNARTEIPVYISFGAATTHAPEPIHQLIATADAKMLAAKRQHHGANRAVIAAWIQSQTETVVDLVDRRVASSGG